jgi:hypothetical protein
MEARVPETIELSIRCPQAKRRPTVNESNVRTFRGHMGSVMHDFRAWLVVDIDETS